MYVQFLYAFAGVVIFQPDGTAAKWNNRDRRLASFRSASLVHKFQRAATGNGVY